MASRSSQTGAREVSASNTTAKCVLSVDVEDWFHILNLPSAPDLSEWASLPRRVERNFLTLLELFAEKNVRTTCFFLGWVAVEYPHLVRTALELGHEVASHGHAHRLVYEMGPREFTEDAARAKRSIEDAGGRPVSGYRAAGFSVTQKTPWFFEKLAEAGYRYDSSIFPAGRNHGGMPGCSLTPFRIQTGSGQVTEFPISVARTFGMPVCLFGGGYLRLAPWPLIKAGATAVLSEGRSVFFYVHPREIDPSQPRLAMTPLRRFMSYVNLQSTGRKLERILSTFEFAPFVDMLPIPDGVRVLKQGDVFCAAPVGTA